MMKENKDFEQESMQMENWNTDQVKQPVIKAKKKNKMVGMLVGALCTGVVAGTAFEGSQLAIQYFTKDKSVATSTEEKKVVATTTSSTSTSSDVSEIVSNVMPSIVAIDTTSTTDTTNMFGQTYSQESSGSGSGIIIGENSDALLVVTNNHVIEGDNVKVTVTFADETTASATVKGAESTSDLAVIAIDKSQLTDDTKDAVKIATLGDSTQTKVGDMAIAIGNALGYGQSVTVGYISAKDREVSLEDSSMKLLQTDAAINPGNSGGALLNAAGEVIGINSVKYASEEVEGMGYAIPISDAIPIINDLMNREQLDVSEQAALGIVGQDVSEEAASTYQMPEGIYVQEVVEGSAAEKAGIVAGDIITGIDDRSISSLSALQEILTYTKAGTKVTIKVQELSNGEYKEKEIEVKLGSKSDSSMQSAQEKSQENQQQSNQQQSNQQQNNQQQNNQQIPFSQFQN